MESLARIRSILSKKPTVNRWWEVAGIALNACENEQPILRSYINNQDHKPRQPSRIVPLCSAVVGNLMSHISEARSLLCGSPSLRSWWRLVEVMESEPELENYVVAHIESQSDWREFRYPHPAWTDKQHIAHRNSTILLNADDKTLLKMRYCPPGQCILGEGGEDPLRGYKQEYGFWMSTTPITYYELYSMGLYGVSLDMLDIMACVSSVTPYIAMALCNLLSEKQGVEPYYILERDFVEAVRTGIEPMWGWGYPERCLKKTKGMNDGYRLPTEDEWEYAARCGFRQQEPHSISCREDLRNFQPTYMEGNAWGFSDMVYGGFEMTGTWDNRGYLKMKGARAEHYRAGWSLPILANSFDHSAFFRVVRASSKT